MTSSPSPKTLCNLLNQFISFRSIDGNNTAKKECLDWVMSTFLQADLSSITRGEVEHSPWLYVKNPDRKLLIFAHLDVVPATDELFELRIEGDVLRGRGVSDMKGHILPFLMAYKDARDAGELPPVSILLTTDEEIAGDTIPQLLAEGILADEPAAFTPDSNDIGIVTEHKGGIWAELVCHGVGGHGAYPWDTKNPYWLLAESLQILQHQFPIHTANDWEITVSPTMTQAGKAGNQVPAEVRCTLDIRYPPEQFSDAEAVIHHVKNVLPTSTELRLIQHAIPLYTDKTTNIVTLYKDVAESVLQTEISFKREHGGTDARYFSAHGIPAFLYGPRGGGLHSKEEWVSLQSLQDHYLMYCALFAKLH